MFSSPSKNDVNPLASPQIHNILVTKETTVIPDTQVERNARHLPLLTTSDHCTRHFKDEYAKKLLLPFTFTKSKSISWKISHYLITPFSDLYESDYFFKTRHTFKSKMSHIHKLQFVTDLIKDCTIHDPKYDPHWNRDANDSNKILCYKCERIQKRNTFRKECAFL